MTGLSRIFNEPVLLGTAIRLTLIAAMAFGAKLTMDQLLALMAALEAIIAVVTRAFVTPNHLAEQRVAMGNSPTTPLTDTQKSNLPPAASILLVGALSLGAIGLPACSSNPTPAADPTVNLSAQGKAAYHATKVVKTLDLLRDVAAEAEKQSPKVVSAQTALKVIAYHRMVVRTIAAVPDGWYSVAIAGLSELQQTIPAAEWAKLEPFVNLLKVLYAEVTRPSVRAWSEELTCA